MHLIWDQSTPLLFHQDFSYSVVVNNYLVWLKDGTSAETLRVYVTHLRAWLQYCEDMQWDWLTITHRNIFSYRAQLDTSLRAKNFHMCRIAGFYDYVGWQGLRNPILGLVHPKNQLIKRTKPQQLDFEHIPQEEVMRFIAALPSKRDRLMALLMYFCGLRRAEVVGLKRDFLADPVVDGMVRFTILGKGEKERVLKMSDALRNELAIYAATHTCAFLFPAWGHKMATGTVNRAFAVARKATSIGIHPHLLRHLYASDRSISLQDEMSVSGSLFNNPLKVLQSELGHSSIATTSAYIHLNDRNVGARSLRDTQRTAIASKEVREVLK